MRAAPDEAPPAALDLLNVKAIGSDGTVAFYRSRPRRCMPKSSG